MAGIREFSGAKSGRGGAEWCVDCGSICKLDEKTVPERVLPERSPKMRILPYLLTLVVLGGVFHLGSVVVRRSREWSMALEPHTGHREAMRRSFFASGRMVQVVAFCWGLVDVVAVMVLVAAMVTG